MSHNIGVPAECPPFWACCWAPYAPHDDVSHTSLHAVARRTECEFVAEFPVPPGVIVFQRQYSRVYTRTSKGSQSSVVTIPLRNLYADLLDPTRSRIVDGRNERRTGLSAADVDTVLSVTHALGLESSYGCCDAPTPNSVPPRPECGQCCGGCGCTGDNCCACAFCHILMTITVALCCVCMVCHVSNYREYNQRLYLKRVNAELATRNPPVRARWARVQPRVDAGCGGNCMPERDSELFLALDPANADWARVAPFAAARDRRVAHWREHYLLPAAAAGAGAGAGAAKPVQPVAVRRDSRDNRDSGSDSESEVRGAARAPMPLAPAVAAAPPGVIGALPPAYDASAYNAVAAVDSVSAPGGPNAQPPPNADVELVTSP